MEINFLIIELNNTESDVRALYDLFVKIDQFYIPSISSRVNLKEYSRKLLRNGKVFCVINSIGEYIGLLAMYVNDKIKNEAFISSIGVLPEYQGKDISSTLMRKAIQVASQSEMKSISLEVNLNNQRAIDFYKKHDFHEEKQTSDSLFMKIELPINQETTSLLSQSTLITEHPSNKGVTPLVTIICITYNHELFIKETIQGFLSQKTNFLVEIIIHDDASTDGTQRIVREYEEKVPQLILPIYQKENQFSVGESIPFVKFIFPRVRGRYIALCEGDDYWTDPLKLQKQIDIFIQYPDTIICGARAKTWNETTKEFTGISPSLDKDISCMSPRHFFYLGDWVKTCTRIVPTELLLSVPPNYLRDYKHVHYLLAKNPNGTFRCLDEVVAVYREHAGGIFSGADPVELMKYNFESKVMLAGLFSDDRLYSMKERAADNASQLAQIKTLRIKERAFYVWQYVYLLYGDISLLGIRRIVQRTLHSFALRLNEYPKIKKFFKSFAFFIRKNFLGK